jgi:hypothetical protein
MEKGPELPPTWDDIQEVPPTPHDEEVQRKGIIGERIPESESGEDQHKTDTIDQDPPWSPGDMEGDRNKNPQLH